MSAAERLLERLDGVRKAGSGWLAFCPGHDDRKKRSLSVTEASGGRLLVHCFSGCDHGRVVKAIGLDERDLFDDAPDPWSPSATYRYDVGTTTQKTKVRRPGKQITVEAPDGTPGKPVDAVDHVYCLPEVLASPRSEPVILTEGEKAADVLRLCGFVVASTGGATAWRKEWSGALRGRHVVLLPDADDAGERWTTAIRNDVLPVAESLRVVRLPVPPKGDAFDFVDGLPDDVDPRDAILDLIAGADEEPKPTTTAEGNGQEAYRPALDLLELGDHVVRYRDPVTWLVDRCVPSDGLVVFGAQPKAGKTTTLAGAFLHAILSGSDFMGRRVTPVDRVGMVLLEDRGQRATEELSRYGIVSTALDGEAVVAPEYRGRLFLHCGPVRSLGSIDPLREAEHWIRSKGLKVFVVDTWGRFTLGQDSGRPGSNVYTDDLRKIDPWAGLAQETGCAIVFTMHSNKLSLKSLSVAMVSGPFSIVGTADTVFVLALEDPEKPDSRRRMTGHVRYGDPLPIFDVTQAEDGRLVFDVADGTDLQQYMAAVLTTVRGNPGCGKRFVLNTVSGRKGNVTAAVDECVTQGLIEITKAGRSHAHTITSKGGEWLSGE